MTTTSTEQATSPVPESEPQAGASEGTPTSAAPVELVHEFGRIDA